MNCILLSAISVLSAVAMLGQTSNKPAVTSAALPAAAPLSDRELNTRAYIELLRSDLKKAKSQVMGQILQLDAAQSAKFWPIYQSFESELTAIGDEIVTLVHDYSVNYNGMTDSVADKLAVKLLDIEQKRNDLKRKYYLRLKQELDAITAARFLQVENQLEKLLDLQIAAELPVMRQN